MTHYRRRSQTNREEISRCQLIASERFNVSLKVYKSVKALTQLAGVAAGIYAMWLNADPLIVFAIMGIIISGPEVAEYFWANGAADDGTE